MKTHQKGAGAYRYSIKCPNCQSQSIIRSSQDMSNKSKTAWAQCTNIKCDAAFVVAIEVIRMINRPHPAAIRQDLPPLVEDDFFINDGGDLLGDKV